MSIEALQNSAGQIQRVFEQHEQWDPDELENFDERVCSLMGDAMSKAQTLQHESQEAVAIQRVFVNLNDMHKKICAIRSNILTVGGHSFQKIPYDAMEPGDIICTYESTSTVPSVIEATEFQKMLNSSDKQDLHKMLHFEVILKKHPRAGVYDIAHASGLRKEVVKDRENFKNYAPGQSIVVFRPKSKALQKKIVEIAEGTCNRGNPWKIRLQSPDTKWIGKIKWFFKALYFEHRKKEKSRDTKIEEAAREAVNVAEGKGLLESNEKDLKAMNCAEYAAGVINSAVIGTTFDSVLKSKNLKHKEKIEVIADSLERSRGYKNLFAAPIEYNSPEVNAASFIDFFLKHPDDWQPVGYIGSHHDVWKEDDIYVERVGNQLTKSSQLEGIREILGVSNDHILKALRGIGILNFNNYFRMSNVNQPEKRKAAFALLYGEAENIKPGEVAEFLSDLNHQHVIESLDHFEREFREFKTHHRKIVKGRTFVPNRKRFIQQIAGERHVSPRFIAKYLIPENRERFEEIQLRLEEFNREIDKQIPKPERFDYHDKSDELPIGLQASPKERKKLYNMERQFIKTSEGNSQLSASEKIKKISLNYIHQKQVKAAKEKLYAKRFLMAGVVTLPLLPIGLALCAIGLGLRRHANRLEKTYQKWENRINSVYEKGQPNTRMKLKADVGVGNRPWIQYTTDGKTWETEPLWLVNPPDEWEVRIRFDDDLKNLEYKFFIGSDDENTPDPLNEAKAWMNGDNIVVPRNYFVLRDGFQVAPEVTNPGWNWK